jgi:transposase
MPLPVAGPVPGCWLISSFPSTTITYRSIAKEALDASASCIGLRKPSTAPPQNIAEENDNSIPDQLPKRCAVGVRRSCASCRAKSELAAAFRYMRARWAALVRCFDDGRLALDNNPSEWALRCVAIGRKNYLFAGSDAGGRRAAAMYSLIETAKLNQLNPQLYIADLLARIADHPARHIADLLPWNWKPTDAARDAA